MMTIEGAEGFIEAIKNEANVQHDDESAHALEDEFHMAVLATIAAPDFDNIAHAKELCRLAVSTHEINFSRWCA
jgi:hypothetical protein